MTAPALDEPVWEGLDIDSAGADGPSGRTKPLPFRSAREIVAEAPTAVPWIVRLLVAAGSITELDGRLKSAGKTTFVLHLVRSVLDGETFCGQPTSRSPVVYLTEQPPTTLRVALLRAGLGARDDLRLLLWRDARSVAWPRVVEDAVAECQEGGARLLVVDTLPQFAGMRGDSENDAGTALAAIAPLQAAAAEGLGVIVIRHERKGGGEIGESARGSSALGGAVDVILRLERPSEQMRPTIRKLTALSRFDETPAETMVELTDEGYVALGSETAVAQVEAKRTLLTAVDGTALTMEAIEGLGVSRTTAQTILPDLIDDGFLERIGRGVKGDPYRYQKPSRILSAQPKGLGQIERIPAPIQEVAQ